MIRAREILEQVAERANAEFFEIPCASRADAFEVVDRTRKLRG